MDATPKRCTTAALEHLTGPGRGTATWLSGLAVDVILSESGLVRVADAATGTSDQKIIARLHPAEDTYEIEARGESPVWINGERVSAKRLEPRDLIEFGNAGPLSRYRPCRDGSRVRKSVAEIIGDCIDYTRVSRRPVRARTRNALRDLVQGLSGQTTVLFRVSVVASLAALAVLYVQQFRSSDRLEQRVESEAAQLQSFAGALTRAQREALRPGDLKALRQELSHRLESATDRLSQLEERSESAARAIAAATRSVAFLQGAYGFRESETGRMMRYMVDSAGRTILSFRSQPMLTLEGDGPVAERQFTGTAFVVTEAGALLTNRHVALPWEDDVSVERLAKRGIEPVLIKLIGYLPEIGESFPVQLLKASDDVDLAVLVRTGEAAGVANLRIAKTPAKPGDEVIVMGYPTGLRSLLAQTGTAFLDELEDGGNLDFWAVAARLSKDRFIRPLATRGIVGQVAAATVIYDADTTHGGSGGPVLDVNGDVVAVNTAIIPDYGGANIGVPAEHISRLLEEAGAN